MWIFSAAPSHCFLACTHLTAGVSCWITFSTRISVKTPVLLCRLHRPLCNRQVGGSNIWSRERSLIPWGLWAFVLTCVAGFWSFVIGRFPPHHWIVVVSILVSLSLRRCMRLSGSFLFFVFACLLTTRLHWFPVFWIGSSWSLGIGASFLSKDTNKEKSISQLK